MQDTSDSTEEKLRDSIKKPGEETDSNRKLTLFRVTPDSEIMNNYTTTAVHYKVKTVPSVLKGLLNVTIIVFMPA